MVWRNTAIWDGRSLKKINHVTVNPQIDCDLMWLDASSPLPSMMLPSLPDVRAIWLRISAPFPELHGLHWLHCQGHFVAPFPTFFHPKKKSDSFETIPSKDGPVQSQRMPWLSVTCHDYIMLYTKKQEMFIDWKKIFIRSISEVYQK